MQSMTLHLYTQLTWAIANMEAFHAASAKIEPVHFFLALLKIMDDAFYQEAEILGISDHALSGLKSAAEECRACMEEPNVKITQLRRAIRKSLSQKEMRSPSFMLHRSDLSRSYFSRAVELAAEEYATALTIVHLLKALLLEPSPDISGFLKEIGFRKSATGADAKAYASKRRIEKLGRNLTDLAREKRLAPVFGRDREMKTLARYLVRTSKRNVIIIGEAGVGKTAVVEGLAQRLISKEGHEFLRDLAIIQLNVSDLVAGTKYRGEMEERVQGIIQEAVSDPNLVLFFDEIHLLMKAGSSSEFAMDIANILKPALSNDDFRCIGATTTEEYERYIKSDAAFLRRFQILRVEEPSAEEVEMICRQWAKRIESLQHVVFDENAIKAAITMSGQWIPNRSFPDKAIDLLENAAAFVKITSLSSRNISLTKKPLRVGRHQIVEALEEQYGISVNNEEIIDVEKIRYALKENLVGQDEAIDALVESLVALSARKEDSERPLAVFLFTGPTGVGKTFTAECISRVLFGDNPRTFACFNMNEYKERHDLARLIGAPPGFVGHDQQGALFRFIEKAPQGIVLLDEFEKAHPEIQDFFLQIFDKVKARDSRGREASFRRLILIMTCNMLQEEDNNHRIGFQGIKEDVEKDRPKSVETVLLKYFRREFLARCDRVIEFRPLSLESYQLVIERLIAAIVSDFLTRHGICFDFTEEATKHLFNCVRETMKECVALSEDLSARLWVLCMNI